IHTEVVRSLRTRHAPLLDQPHCLKLELPCKLPSLHDSPPVPSKHLTRCLRNRVQASRSGALSVRRRESDLFVPLCLAFKNLWQFVAEDKTLTRGLKHPI